jgi:alcohol dehydrogenase class IV
VRSIRSRTGGARCGEHEIDAATVVLAVGDGSAVDTAKAASAESGLQVVSVPKAGEALSRSGLCLGHAMAQALGGRYGLPHGAMNALCLPPALRFNEPVAGEAITAFGKSLGTDEPAARVEELARLGGFHRLRDFGVPDDELEEVAEATAVRAGAKANPRPASPAEITEVFRSIW